MWVARQGAPGGVVQVIGPPAYARRMLDAIVGAVGQAPPAGVLAKFGDPLVGELATPVVLDHHGDPLPGPQVGIAGRV
ncbi:MAG: hypothetical protein ACRDQD_08665, partial [Nocardioidaceae bacterium]